MGVGSFQPKVWATTTASQREIPLLAFLACSGAWKSTGDFSFGWGTQETLPGYVCGKPSGSWLNRLSLKERSGNKNISGAVGRMQGRLYRQSVTRPLKYHWLDAGIESVHRLSTLICRELIPCIFESVVFCFWREV